MKNLKAAILSMSLLTVMAGAAISPALGPIGQAFSEASETQIKLIITLPSLFTIIAAFSFQMISSKISLRNIALIGMLFYIVGGFIACFTNTIYTMLFCRALLGIGVGLLTPLSTGLLAYYFTKQEQTKLMGYSAAMNNMGGIIAAILSSILVLISWRFVFAVYLLGLIAIVLIFRNVPNEKIVNNSEKLNMKDIKAIAPYLLLIFLIMFNFYIFPSNFSIIATKEKIIPVHLIGLVMAIQNIAAFIAGLKLSSISELFKGSTKFFAFGSLALGMFLLCFMNEVIPCFFGLIFVGIGSGMSVALTNSQISFVIDQVKTPGDMSLMSAFLYLGQFISPIVVDTLKNVFTLNSPFAVATIFSMILFVLIFKTKITINQ